MASESSSNPFSVAKAKVHYAATSPRKTRLIFTKADTRKTITSVSNTTMNAVPATVSKAFNSISEENHVVQETEASRLFKKLPTPLYNKAGSFPIPRKLTIDTPHTGLLNCTMRPLLHKELAPIETDPLSQRYNGLRRGSVDVRPAETTSPKSEQKKMQQTYRLKLVIEKQKTLNEEALRRKYAINHPVIQLMQKNMRKINVKEMFLHGKRYENLKDFQGFRHCEKIFTKPVEPFTNILRQDFHFCTKFNDNTSFDLNN